MSTRSKLLKIGIPLLILLSGFVAMRLLIASRPVPKRQEKPVAGALVELLEVRPETRRAEIFGTGTVTPAQEISITPQVKGSVSWVSPRLVAGGFFNKDELLFAIASADYELALERAQALVAKAELELATIESKALIARSEWQKMNLTDRAPNPLVLQEPQLASARAGLASALAAVRQAELDLSRTRIVAPFNCRIRSEQVDYGQYVKDGMSVAIAAGTDRAEIVVPLPLGEMDWLFGPNGDSPAARIELRAGPRRLQWQGRVDRSLGEVDAKGRLAQVVVTVADPYALKTGSKNRLEAGMFVEVFITGRETGPVFMIPRKALRDASTVWIMDENNALRIRPVAVLRKEGEHVLIDKGLAAGDKVVLTTLSGAADGMQLRAVASGEAP